MSCKKCNNSKCSCIPSITCSDVRKCETLTKLKSEDGNLLFKDEKGNTTTIPFITEETITLLQNTIEGHKIGDYTNEIEDVVDINETVTTLVNNEDNTYTYTNEEGTETIITIPESEALKFGYPLEDVLADGNRNFDLDGNEFVIDNVGRWDFKTYIGNDFVQIESNISTNSFSIWSFTENDFFQANSGSDFKDVRVYDVDGNDFFALTENTDEKSLRLYNRLDNEYFTLVSDDSNDQFRLNSRSGADLLSMNSSLTDYELDITSFIGNTWIDFQSNNSYNDMRVLNRAGDDFVQFFTDATNHQIFFKAKTATNNDFIEMNSTDALKFFGVRDYEGNDFFILESTDSYKTIKIDIPSKGEKKVLTSDADGFATWEIGPRFAVATEDDTASQNRSFDSTGFDFQILDFNNFLIRNIDDTHILIDDEGLIEIRNDIQATEDIPINIFSGANLNLSAVETIYVNGGSFEVASSIGSVMIGSASTIDIAPTTYLTISLPIYADNAAATIGGVPLGAVYKTATGELRIVV